MDEVDNGDDDDNLLDRMMVVDNGDDDDNLLDLMIKQYLTFFSVHDIFFDVDLSQIH